MPNPIPLRRILCESGFNIQYDKYRRELTLTDRSDRSFQFSGPVDVTYVMLAKAVSRELGMRMWRTLKTPAVPCELFLLQSDTGVEEEDYLDYDEGLALIEYGADLNQILPYGITHLLGMPLHYKNFRFCRVQELYNIETTELFEEEFRSLMDGFQFTPGPTSGPWGPVRGRDLSCCEAREAASFPTFTLQRNTAPGGVTGHDFHVLFMEGEDDCDTKYRGMEVIDKVLKYPNLRTALIARSNNINSGFRRALKNAGKGMQYAFHDEVINRFMNMRITPSEFVKRLTDSDGYLGELVDKAGAIYGWHQVFHSYAMATAILSDRSSLSLRSLLLEIARQSGGFAWRAAAMITQIHATSVVRCEGEMIWFTNRKTITEIGSLPKGRPNE